MTDSQRAAMIRFTLKIENAYRNVGRIADAEAAKRHREFLLLTAQEVEDLEHDIVWNLQHPEAK